MRRFVNILRRIKSSITALFSNQKALTLDGINQYVTVADADDLSFGDGTTDIPFSISFWAKWDETAGGFISKYTGQREYTIFAQSATEFRVYIYDLSAAVYIRKFGMVAPDECKNQWAHYTMTYDGSSVATGINLYVNGISLSGTSNGTGAYVAMENTTAPIEIGRWNSGNIWGGKMDQVCIFRNVELTLAEIKELIALRDVTQHSQAANLVLYHQYEDANISGTTVTDLSGAGNDGTLVNGATNTTCIPWPYQGQLSNSATYENLTPMQSDDASPFGGFSWRFDGVSDYLRNLDVTSVLNFGNGTTDSPFSISAWFYTEDGIEWQRQTIFDRQNEYWFGCGFIGGNEFFSLVIRDNSAAVWVGAGIDMDPAYKINQWYHFVATYDGTGGATAANGIKLYINGVETTPTTVTNNASYVAMENVATQHRIGLDISLGGSYRTDGFIDEVIILDKELSAVEVAEMYNSHEPRNEGEQSLSANIVGRWNGYNSTNTTDGVLDQSGNGIDFTGISMLDTDISYNIPRAIFDSDNQGSFDFNGSTQYINIPDDDSLTMTDGVNDVAFSISLWAYIDDATNFAFFSKGDNTSGIREYQAIIGSSDQLIWFVYDESASASIGGRTNNTVATQYEEGWHHFVFTYNGNASAWTDLAVYVDGGSSDILTVDISAGSYTAMENTATSAKIGYSDTAERWADGKIAQVTIMKGIELDLCQRQEIYNNGSPVDPTNWSFYGNWTSASHWKLNQADNPAGTVTDIIGTNNGTAINTPTLSTIVYPTN